MGYEQEEVQHHSRANDALYICIYTVPRLLASAASKLFNSSLAEELMMRYIKKEKKNVSYTKQRAMMV